MQEVIQERRACRNVFEVLEFICVDYDSYLKARLVNLASKRCNYRNGFGLRKLQISSGISQISRLGHYTFIVVQSCESGSIDVIVEMQSGACSHCELSKFCVHVSAVACMFPESMVSVVYCQVCAVFLIEYLDNGFVFAKQRVAPTINGSSNR